MNSGLTVDVNAKERGRQRDRALAQSASAAVLVRLTSSACTVAVLAMTAGALRPAAFGVFAVLSGVAIYLNLGDLGFGNVIMTRLPAMFATGDRGGASLLTTTAVVGLSALGAIVAICGAVSAYTVPWTEVLGANGVSPSAVQVSIVSFSVSAGISLPSTIGQRVLVACQRSASVHLWNTAANVLSALLVIVEIGLHASLPVYVATVVGVPTAFFAIQTVWVFSQHIAGVHFSREGLRPRGALLLVKKSGPYAIINTTSLVAFYIDSFIVASIMGAPEAAVFAVASRMFSLVNGTLSLAGQQLWTALSDAIARQEYEWARSRYWRLLVVVTGIACVTCTVLAVAGQVIAKVWVGSRLTPPVALLVLMAVWTTYSAFTIQGAYLLASVGQVKAYAGLLSAMACANVALSIVFTRWLGLVGPVCGSLVSHVAIVAVPAGVLTFRVFSRLRSRDVYREPA